MYLFVLYLYFKEVYISFSSVSWNIYIYCRIYQIHKIVNNMGKLQYKDLPFFYAATGSDKTSSLYGLEKRIALGADKWIDYHDVPDKMANIIICSVDTFLEKINKFWEVMIFWKYRDVSRVKFSIFVNWKRNIREWRNLYLGNTMCHINKKKLTKSFISQLYWLDWYLNLSPQNLIKLNTCDRRQIWL